MPKKSEFLNKKSFSDFSSFIKGQKIKLIKNVKFHYVGFHNITFKAKYDNFDVQIRIPNSTLINRINEKKVCKNYSNCLYYKNGFLIRKWYSGKSLDKIKITKQIQLKIIKAVKKLHKEKWILKKFDWLHYKTDDLRFLQLVKKYKKTDLVVSHCDLNAKNIILNNKKIKFIDFEWMRLAPKHFDAISIMKNFQIERKIIKEEFGISNEELTDFEYMFEIFNKDAYKSVYDMRKALNSRLLGKTNINHRFEKYFIQKKIKNGYNHKFKSSLLPKTDFLLPIIYEDDKILIREYIQNNFSCWNDESLKKIASTLAQMHRLTFNLPKNTIKKQFIYYLNKSYKKIKEFLIDDSFIESMIDFSKKLNEKHFVHNDLCQENIIFDVNGNVKFIDLEYASQGNKYYDLAYFIEANKLTNKQSLIFINNYFKDKYDKNKLQKFRLFVNFFGLLWSLNNNDEDSGYIEYNLERIKILRKYFF